MPPKPVTQAARRGKRVIASPVSSPSVGGSEGEDELDMDLESEEEEAVVPIKNKGKGKAEPPKRPPSRASEDVDMDIDDDELASDDELDVIDDFESEEDEEGEEEKEDDDDEYDDEEGNEATVPTPKPSASSSRRPAATTPVYTPSYPSRASRAPAPVPATTPTASVTGSVSGNKSGLRIRLNVPRPSPLGRGAVSAAPAEGSRRPAREAAKTAGKKSKVVAMEAELGSDQDAPGSSEEDELADEDELDDEPEAEGEEEMDMDMDIDMPEHDRRSDGQSSRAVSPTKLTARQRARGNADLQGVLIALPNEASGAKKPILTEAERVSRREEMARRRKRQLDQRMQDEQDETINRLLRAQTSRSRNKIEAPETGSGDVTPDPDGKGGGMNGRGEDGLARSRGRHGAVKEGMVRWVSTIVPSTTAGEEGKVTCRVGIPKGLMESTTFPYAGVGGGDGGKTQVVRGCAVDGCTNGRKYRSTHKFEVGGCSLEHLRLVNDRLRAL